VEEKVQITIIGTGCVGTSIGLALHAADAPALIVGHDKKPEHAGLARKKGAVDKVDWNLLAACENADMVVLAIPMTEIEETLRLIAPELKPGCVITDTASLKVPIFEWAQALLPDNVNFVGGSPLIAASGSGPEGAKADLFRDCRYSLTPAPDAHPDAVGLVSSMVTILGADPYFLDPQEHDSLTAGAANLPTVVSLSLTSAMSEEASWRELRKFSDANFDTFSAMMGEDAAATTQALLSNRENLMRWLDAYLIKMQQIRRLLAENAEDELDAMVEKAVEARRNWLRDREKRFSEIPEAPKIERPNLLHHILPRRLVKRD
jgi:prephenate dehydrogenase